MIDEPDDGPQPGDIVVEMTLAQADQVMRERAARDEAIGILSAALPEAARVLVQGLDRCNCSGMNKDREQAALSVFEQHRMLVIDRDRDESPFGPSLGRYVTSGPPDGCSSDSALKES